MIKNLQLYGTERRFYLRWYGLDCPMFTWSEACALMSKLNRRVVNDWSLADDED